MDDQQARTRFFLIAAHRLIGAVLIILGLLVLSDYIDWPHTLGWVFIPLGIFDFFVFPLILARRYRTPK